MAFAPGTATQRRGYSAEAMSAADPDDDRGKSTTVAEAFTPTQNARDPKIHDESSWIP